VEPVPRRSVVFALILNRRLAVKHTARIALAIVALTAGAGIANAADATKSDQPVTDSYITTKVKAELTADKVTKARDIHVTTKDGVVALTGNVTSAAEKEQASTDAQKIKGVVSVKNDLMVK
jgi:hyperosmotically inducible periplasmic protein